MSTKISIKEYLDIQVTLVAGRLAEISLGNASSDDEVPKLAKKLADRILALNDIEVDEPSTEVENAEE